MTKRGRPKTRCEVCKKSKAIYECEECGRLHCERCYDIYEGECSSCYPPQLVLIQDKE